MAKLIEERETTTRNIVLMLARSLALACVALAVFHSPAAAQGKGDTPVVLVGGSVHFKAGSQPTADDWQEKTKNQDYFYTVNLPVNVIVLKNSSAADGNSPDPDDSNPTTDNNRISISDPNSWRVDLFTLASPSVPVAHLEPQADGIHIILDDAKGQLCPTPNQIAYQPTADCSQDKKPKFSQINLIVASKQVANLTCMDAKGHKNKCRFVLRSK